MKTWFTSDTHFGHENIIGYCDRPYDSVQAMDADLIRRWNQTVAPEDLVYHLGDFALGDRTRWPEVLASLHGRKILCVGNHDQKPEYMMRQVGFEYAFENRVVEVEGKRLWLNHYPMNNSSDRRRYQRPAAPSSYDVALCGHVHQQWKVRAGCVNVSVDVWNFTPTSLEQILAAHKSSES